MQLTSLCACVLVKGLESEVKELIFEKIKLQIKELLFVRVRCSVGWRFGLPLSVQVVPFPFLVVLGFGIFT